MYCMWKEPQINFREIEENLQNDKFLCLDEVGVWRRLIQNLDNGGLPYVEYKKHGFDSSNQIHIRSQDIIVALDITFCSRVTAKEYLFDVSANRNVIGKIRFRRVEDNENDSSTSSIYRCDFTSNPFSTNQFLYCDLRLHIDDAECDCEKRIMYYLLRVEHDIDRRIMHSSNPSAWGDNLITDHVLCKTPEGYRQLLEMNVHDDEASASTKNTPHIPYIERVNLSFEFPFEKFMRKYVCSKVFVGKRNYTHVAKLLNNDFRLGDSERSEREHGSELATGVSSLKLLIIITHFELFYELSKNNKSPELMYHLKEPFEHYLYLCKWVDE